MPLKPDLLTLEFSSCNMWLVKNSQGNKVGSITYNHAAPGYIVDALMSIREGFFQTPEIALAYFQGVYDYYRSD